MPGFPIEDDDQWELLSILCLIDMPFTHSSDSMFTHSLIMESGVVETMGVMLRQGPHAEFNRNEALDMLRIGVHADLTCNEHITVP